MPISHSWIIVVFAILSGIYRCSIALRILHPKTVHSITNSLFVSSPAKHLRLQFSRITLLKFKVSDEAPLEDSTKVDFLSFPTTPSQIQPTANVFQKLSNGIIPIAASIGFAVTPSAAIAVRVAGAAAGGAAGLLAKRTLLDRLFRNSDSDGPHRFGKGTSTLRQEAAEILDSLISDESVLPTATLKEIEKAAKKHQIPEKDLKFLFTYIFTTALLRITESEAEETDLLSLQTLLDFTENIGFTSSEIGDGFNVAAMELRKTLKRDEAGFFLKNYSQELLLQTSKIYFLADKLIRENRGYYGSRLDTAISYFTPEMYTNLLTHACKQMFRNFVSNVLSSPDQFSSEEMTFYEQFLTTSPQVSDFRPANMQNFIREAFQFTLDQSLPVHGAPTTPIDFEALSRAKGVFGWNTFEFDATVEAKTIPVFERETKEIFRRCIEDPEKAQELAAELNLLVKSLQIDAPKARAFLITQVSEQNAAYMNQISQVYEVAGELVEPAFKIMVSYARTWDALKEMTEGVMNDSKIPIPSLPFKQMVKVNMYQMQLDREKAGKSTNLQDEMFTLSEDQRNAVKKYMAVPKITSWVAQCISENNFDASAKAAYRNLLTQYKVDDKEWESTAVDFYYQEMQKVARNRAIPTDVDMTRMKSIAEFLSCPSALVSAVNMDLLGDKYLKAVSEAMTPGGVIVEEYKDGLERLRNRLQLTHQDARTLLGVSARARLVPVVKDLVEVWKSDKDGSRKTKGKDKSGDPISSVDNILGFMETGAQKEGGGPNVFMREALNLVDFFTSNYLMEANVDLASMETMPVTAVGTSSEEDILGAYKHYLITTLAETDETMRERYVEAERIFALVLGIAPTSQSRVKQSLAYTAYKNMLKNILRVKESVETSDLQQFAVLKDRLRLDTITSEKVLEDATKGAVLEHAAGLIRPKTGDTITPEAARRFRYQIQSLGLDIRTDTGFNDKLVAYLYALEVQYMVDNDLEGEFVEAQETYGIPPETAQQVVEACCKRFSSQILNLALREARKYNEKGCLEWMQLAAKYTRFVSGVIDADGNKFSEDDKERLVKFYEGSLKEQGIGEDELEETITRMRSIINLTPDFVPPLQGIDGLVGKLSGMQSVGGDGTDNKQKWAWGG